MYLKGLDELDRKILDLLTQNARYTYSELGERLGLSRVAIKNRMDALEERGIIEGYTVIVNPQNTWAKELTVEDLKKIWSPDSQGKVMKWSDVRPAWPDTPAPRSPNRRARRRPRRSARGTFRRTTPTTGAAAVRSARRVRKRSRARCCP